MSTDRVIALLLLATREVDAGDSTPTLLMTQGGPIVVVAGSRITALRQCYLCSEYIEPSTRIDQRGWVGPGKRDTIGRRNSESPLRVMIDGLVGLLSLPASTLADREEHVLLYGLLVTPLSDAAC